MAMLVITRWYQLFSSWGVLRFWAPLSAEPLDNPHRKVTWTWYTCYGANIFASSMFYVWGADHLEPWNLAILLVGERRSSYWCCHVQGSLPHGRKASVAFWELCSQNFCRCQGKNWVQKSRQYPTQKSDGLLYYVPNLQFFMTVALPSE